MSVLNPIQPLTASVSIALMKLTREMKEPICETVSLEDCISRVLAHDFEGPFSLPPFRRAAMDGYAIYAASSGGASKERRCYYRLKGNSVGSIRAYVRYGVRNDDCGSYFHRCSRACWL